jgi:hypothetical protein
MSGWFARQGRRALWLAQDLGRLAGGLGRVLVFARRREPVMAIGLLEGHVRALEGQTNVYRIRLARDGSTPLRVELALRGERDGRTLETRVTCEVPGGGAHELYLVTDWLTRFETVAIPPVTDELVFLSPGMPAGSCRITATLLANDQMLDELTITQPVTACESRT